MVIAGDFVLVRFATKSYSFMRVAHVALAPWLDSHKVKYTRKGHRLYFELPDHLVKYTVITQGLCDELKILGLEVKKVLHSLSYMQARRFRDRLTMEEITLIIENDLPLQL